MPRESADRVLELAALDPTSNGHRPPPSHAQGELPSPKAPMAVARVMVDANHRTTENYVAVHHWRGGFWHWRQRDWVELDDKAARSQAYRFTEHATYIERTQKGDYEVRPWAPNRYKVADLLDALAAVCHLPERLQPPTWTEVVAGMPPARELVSVGNGLLHVATRRLLAHDPRLFNQVSVPFAYDPDAPSPVGWLRFLKQLWADDEEAVCGLQEFFGYVISGRTDLHKILLLVGPTRSGKGVTARVLKHLIGKANVTGPTLASLGTNFGLQDLIAKSLAIISDARLGAANVHQVVERLLSVSGEDTLTVDRKYRDPWTGQLPTRFLVISNELPRFGDASGAIANRFVLLTTRHSFLGKENPGLTQELVPEMPGILNWALDGLERLQQQGRFTEPESSRDAIVALQDLTSPVAAFVRDRCSVGPVLEAPVDELYRAWKAWAEENGHRISTAQTFGRDLRAAVPGLAMTQPREHGVQRRLYRGIAFEGRDDNGPTRVSPRVSRPVDTR